MIPTVEKLTPENIRFNYYSGSCYEDPERWEERIVGYKGVVEIREHAAQGEGDKWYWDVHYENNRVERIFHPHQIFYKKTITPVVPTEYPRINTTTKAILP